MMKSRKPFTLIELLVAVAVVVILVATVYLFVPLPSRRKADKVVCQSRLWVVALAALCYSADHDGYLPPQVESLDWTAPYETDFSWHQGICSVQDAYQLGSGYGFNLLLHELPDQQERASICFAWDGKDVDLTHCGELDRILERFDFDRHAPEGEDRANVAFLDGHVKWTLKSEIVMKNFKP